MNAFIFFGRSHFVGSVAGQKCFIENSQGMLRLPDLPVSNTLTLREISQECLDVFSRSGSQMLFREETGKRLRPSHLKGRTIRTYPVLLRAGPEDVPKFPLLFGVGEIHGSSYESTVISAN